MKVRSALAKWPLLQSPWVKYGAITLALGLWSYGLVDQFHSLAAAVTYLLISLLIVVIAVF